MKNKRNIFILALAIIIILIIIFGGILLKKHQSRQVSNDNIAKNEESNTNTDGDTNNSVLSDEEKQKVINEIASDLNTATDKEVLSINGKKVSEKEIALVNFQINNSYVNNTENTKDTIKEIIEENVIIQNANSIGMNLTNEKEIEERINKILQNDVEETNSLAKSLNMTYEELKELYINRTKDLELITNWKMKITDEINSGNLNVNDETFKNKYNEYKNSNDVKAKTSLLLELQDIYIEYLVGQALVEYFN